MKCEVVEEKLREQIRIVQEWGSLSKASGPRKGRAVCPGVWGNHSVHLPALRSAPGKTQTICNVQFGTGNSWTSSIFKRRWGCVQAAGNWALPAWGGWRSKATSPRLQQPWGAHCLPNCSAPEPILPPREREEVPGRHCASSPPASRAAGRRPRDPPPRRLTYGGVVGEGALVLVDPVAGPGHADRGHVGHQQLADVSCSHLPASAAARHAEQGAPALHGLGTHRSRASRAGAGARCPPAAVAPASGRTGGLRGRPQPGEPGRAGRAGRGAGAGTGGSGRAGDAAIFNPMASLRPSCSVRRGWGAPAAARRGGGAGEGPCERAGLGGWGRRASP